MAAFNFHSRQTRGWWYAGATLVAVAFLCVFYVGGAFAVISGPPASPSGFESSDGNMTNDTATTHSDWNCFANGKSSGFASPGVNVGATPCNSNLDYAAAHQVTADGNGEISWVNGQKFDTACPALSVNNNPPKDEFTNVASYNETDPSTKDLFIYGATIRPNTNGNSTGNVELDQKAGNGTTTAGCRTAGDRLIAYDFLNGGTTLNFHVLTWITSANSTAGGNNGTCFVKTDSDALASNGTGGCWGANVIVPDSTTFEGGVNTAAAITALNNGISGGTRTGATSVPALAFAEFGINASKAFGTEGVCTSFAQVQWESRSSGSSFTSNPQDIETEGTTVSNCGQIIIRKVTVPSPDPNNTSFSYSDNIASASDTFSLKNGGSKDFGSSVIAGPYSVTESAQPGYKLTSINCSASSTANGSSASGSTSTGTTTINLKPGDVVDCTYTNTLQTATLSTQQSTTTTSVTPGTSVNDLATVVGSNTSVTPSGNVTFYLCGSTTTTLTGCSSSDTSRTQVGSTVGLSGSGGTATATSSNVNTSSSPLAPGSYCFEASWPGDTNYPGAKDDTGGVNECFTVAQIPTNTVTTPGDSSGTNPESSIILGGTIYDTAVVTGTTAGGTPTGDVVFHVCGPPATSCATGGTLVGASTGVTLGAPTTSTSATAISAGFTPSAAGTYCFRGDYGGNLVYSGSSDSGSDECFTVNQISTGTVTTPSVGQNGTTTFGDTTVYDTAVITAGASGGGSITGTVDFWLCSPSQMAALSESTCNSGGTGSGSTTLLTDLATTPPSASATSDAFTSGVNQTGTWCWRAVYTPGGTDGSQYTGSSDSSSTECFTVTDTTSGSSAQNWLPNDSGTVSAAHGAPLNGTLSIQLYDGSLDCSTGAVSTQKYSQTLTNATSPGDRTVTSNNTTYLVSASDHVSWKVTFTSSDPNVASSDHCESSSLTINN